MGATTRGRFEERVLALVGGYAMLGAVMRSMLRARDALRRELAVLHRRTLAIAREDEMCRRLMTVPGVGAIVSLTYRTGVDDPGRFTRSKALGAYFGLTPKRHQSGEADRVGSITKAGDAGVRTALYEAANVLLTRVARFSSLKRWAMEVARRRGLRRARVAPARKLSVVLHRIWVDGTEFRWGKKDGAATMAACSPPGWPRTGSTRASARAGRSSGPASPMRSTLQGTATRSSPGSSTASAARCLTWWGSWTIWRSAAWASRCSPATSTRRRRQAGSCSASSPPWPSSSAT